MHNSHISDLCIIQIRVSDQNEGKKIWGNNL